MKHIKTPTVLTTQESLEIGEHGATSFWPVVKSADGRYIGSGDNNYESAEEALEDPLANELKCALDSHNALVEALEEALTVLKNVKTLFHPNYLVHSSQLFAKIEDALKSAKGETV